VLLLATHIILLCSIHERALITSPYPHACFQVVQELSTPQRLESLDARGISNLLWGFARLEHHPGLAFMDSLLDRMLPMLMTQDHHRRWVLGVTVDSLNQDFISGEGGWGLLPIKTIQDHNRMWMSGLAADPAHHAHTAELVGCC
jgi:hypothetical protein